MIHIRHVPRFFAGAQNDCRGGKNVTLAPSSGRSSAIAVRIDLCCAKAPTGGIKTHGPKGRYHNPRPDRAVKPENLCAVRRIKRKNPFVHNLSTQPDCVSRPQPAAKPRPLEPFEPGPRSGPLISFYLPFAAHVKNGSVGGVGQALDGPYAVLGGGVNVAVFHRYNVFGGPHGSDGGI